jgi:DegV family protein with EDD domain
MGYSTSNGYRVIQKKWYYETIGSRHDRTHPPQRKGMFMVKIITDTTSCLSSEFGRQHDIPIIPQVINFGNESFLEGVNMSIADFMRRLQTSPELPKTAAPPTDLFYKEFARLVPLGEPILCIHPSIEVSGTVRSAQVAAQDFPGADIRIIDTRLIASPLASLVHKAAEWAESGLGANVIEARLREMMGRGRIYFLVATLEYLAKGGRIGGAAALVGSVLQIKPLLTFREGKVDVFEKERTHRRALERLHELVTTQIPPENGYLSVLHAGVPEQGHALANSLMARLGLKDVPVYDMPPAIVTHGGPGILGAAFFVA